MWAKTLIEERPFKPVAVALVNAYCEIIEAGKESWRSANSSARHAASPCNRRRCATVATARAQTLFKRK